MIVRKSRTVSRALALLAGSLLLCGAGASAQAASYCWFSPNRLVDGGATTGQLTIVVASVPRVSIPGRPDNRPWCTQRFTSIGGHSQMRVIEQPKLGAVRAGGYRVSYRGDKVGHDRFVLEVSWLRWASTERQKATLTFEIDVVAQAF